MLGLLTKDIGCGENIVTLDTKIDLFLSINHHYVD